MRKINFTDALKEFFKEQTIWYKSHQEIIITYSNAEDYEYFIAFLFEYFKIEWRFIAEDNNRTKKILDDYNNISNSSIVLNKDDYYFLSNDVIKNEYNDYLKLSVGEFVDTFDNFYANLYNSEANAKNIIESKRNALYQKVSSNVKNII